MPEISERFDNLGSDGTPARLGIMGGTFDPIHMGHLRVAEEIREALYLNAVLFIPTGNPVFKRDQKVTDAELRLARVQSAIADNPFFDVSRIEIDRGGDTYTVDTLKQLRAHYPENVEFYFIMGSDAAASIGKWRGSAEIAELTRLAVATGRPGSVSEEDLARIIPEAGPFTFHLVRVSILEISSSDIRRRQMEGRSVRYLIPTPQALTIEPEEPVEPVELDESTAEPEESAAEIEEPVDLTGLPDPLTKEFFKERKAELKERVSERRFKHSVGVSKACVQLAKEYGVDKKKARLVGILHDWDKGYDDEGARARVRELGMEDQIDPWVVQNMPRVLHGYTAARALKRDFPQIPSDVLQAIDRHTTAAVDMTPLDMVLYIADAIEPGRQFGKIDDLRAAVGNVTLEELYFQTYEYWTLLLFERRAPLHPDTMHIWNENALRWQREKKNGKDDTSKRKGKEGK